MKFLIDDSRVDALAAELAKRTDEDPIALVIRVLEEKLESLPAPQPQDEARQPWPKP